ncbi:MAG TPA: potassium transporter Kef [Polyangiaceae bacterium]|nr:potassium transporter Kef [Polyangiaceae bacterium]
MSAIGLLLGLLVLAYFGSILVGDRTIRGFGLPSGAEYLLLGFVLGPEVLGVITRSLITSFEPMLVVGAAWLALVAGIGYGQVGPRRVRVGRAVVGALFGLLVGAGVCGAVFWALRFSPTSASLSLLDRLLLSASSGVVLSETTRHTVRWVAERHGAKGTLLDTLADHARASVLVPAMVLAVVFAAAPGGGLPGPVALRVGVTLGVGVLLGWVASLLLGREFRRDESWGIFLGTSLLGMGVSARLGLSAVSTIFTMALTMSAVSPHRAELKAMVAPTEKPVLLPIAVLTGAFVDLGAASFIPLLVAAGIGGRLVLELARGAIVAAAVPSARSAGPLLGLGMLSTGAFTLAAAIGLALRLPPPLGPSVLVLASAGVLVGELLGPVLLRRALERAQEIVPGVSHTPPPPSVDPGAPPPLGGAG